MTFGICLFIVLMQFLWKYVDDMVGKGIGIGVLAEMFFYAALSFVPMALPLAILLASLMTFGNLGEQLELLAMKSAGISLPRIMQPFIVLLAFVAVGAFFFQNNIIPLSQVKMYTLLSSVRDKSPELEIPESTFYSQISGFNVYVKKKDHDGLLHHLMIYDYSDGFNNAQVIVADSGRLKVSTDKQFLVLYLFDGRMFKNLRDQGEATEGGAVPYQKESFKSREILIRFDSEFHRADESAMQDRYVGKNLASRLHDRAPRQRQGVQRPRGLRPLLPPRPQPHRRHLRSPRTCAAAHARNLRQSAGQAIARTPHCLHTERPQHHRNDQGRQRVSGRHPGQ